MPVFRIDIIFANRARFKEHHIVDGVELDTYYRHIYRLSKRSPIAIISFDVVQISEFSLVATFMRENKIKRMAPHTAQTQRSSRTGPARPSRRSRRM